MTRVSIDAVASDEVLHIVDAVPPRPDNYIPFDRRNLAVVEEQEVLDSLRPGWLTTGPKTQRFEQLLADDCRVEHAIGVSSGRAALHRCLVAQDVGSGDKVITSPMTFASTANVIDEVREFVVSQRRGLT